MVQNALRFRARHFRWHVARPSRLRYQFHLRHRRGLLFQYWMRKHRLDWWSRYNFVLAGALDFGTILSSIVIYFALQMPKNGALEIGWWGNQVYIETADVQGATLLTAPEEGFAPPPGEVRSPEMEVFVAPYGARYVSL